MKDNLIYMSVAIGVVLAVLAMVYGVFMPLSSSKSYIRAISTLSEVKTTDEFKAKFKPVLEHPSPIGDEEIPKFFTNDVLNIVSQNTDEGVRRELVVFVEPYIQKDNVRHLLAMSQMYSVLWRDHDKEADYLKAEEYLLTARSIGPKLPPVLYSLANLYQAKGDMAKLQEIIQTILLYWPNDEQAKKLITS